MIKRKSRFGLCINDIILAAALSLVAVVFLIVFSMSRGAAGTTKAVITVDGKVYGIYSLLENKEISVESAHGTNLIIIENGEIYMADSDCPDKYCIYKGKISHSKDTIVCLPHRLVVEINGSEDRQEYDVISE